MVKIIQSYKLAVKYIIKDSTNFLLAMIPIGLGISLYVLIGKWVFGTALESGQQWIQSHLESQNWGAIVYWLAATTLSVLFFFIVNWTFVLMVSLIAAPFNDILSRRVDRQHQGEDVEKLHNLIGQMGSNLIKILFNEVKKILILVILITLAFVLSLIPILVPVSFFLSALILAAGYLDYSWSRYDLPAKRCFSSLKKGWVGYSIVGMGYMILLSIPLLNLLSIPLAVSQFTILFVDNSAQLIEENK